jgi:hypothetical protein
MSGTELLENMRVIWTETLNVPVTESTDFFWEGGHSFMALDIIARTEDALQLRVPLRLLFDNPRFDTFIAALEGLLQTTEN